MKLSNFFKQSHNQAIFALIISNTIWGAASPIFKLALQNIPPFTLAFIRFFGASLILLPFSLEKIKIGKKRYMYQLQTPKRKDVLKLIALSISGITINITFFFYGLRLAPSINAPVIASASPLVLYLFSIFVLKERTHKKVFLGTIISLLGVLVIIGQPVITGEFDGVLMGNLFLVLSMLGAVGHAILSKEIITRYKSAALTFWSFLIGSITFFPFFVQELYRFHPFQTIDHRGWLGILFGVILSSALAYALFEWSVKKMDAQEVGIFTYLDPLAAAIIAIPLLGESITSIYLIGSTLVFIGILVAESRVHWHPLHKLKI